MEQKADLRGSTRAPTWLVGGDGAASGTEPYIVPASNCGWKGIMQEGEHVKSESLCRHGKGGKSKKGVSWQGSLSGCSGKEIR